MNLIIDAGNTLTKTAVFDSENQIVELWHDPKPSLEKIRNTFTKFDIWKAIISDVSNTTLELEQELSALCSVLRMQPHTPVPLQIHYDSLSTLGTDRIAAAVFGASVCEKCDVLVIQAGTCITYEFVESCNQYKGGAISPGIDMRFNAMHNFTARLPLVNKKQINYLAGKSTKESILSGVINGCTAEIDGFIDQYKAQYPSLKVLLGGGDAFFFDKRLKNRIFAVENLVLRGLNIILQFNTNQ